MSKGLIINEDVWTLLEEYEPQEALELLRCLAAFHRGEALPPISRYVRPAYQRIVLDNRRFDPERRAELSSVRSEAGKKGAEQRWQTMVNDGKNGKQPQEEKRIDKNRIDEKREGRFVPPSVEQVQAYASEHGLVMDCNRFVDYFASNGWKVGGKALMKDWRAAARNWAAREQTKRPAGKQPDYKAQLLSVDYGELLRRQG